MFNKKEYQREWRAKNKEKCKAYSAKERLVRKDKITEKRKTPEARKKMLLAVKRWRLENREHYLETEKEKKKRNREKINARFRVTNAIRRGKMERGTLCQNCNSTEGKMEAHHNDYTKPYEVTWLCWHCHRKEHGKLLSG